MSRSSSLACGWLHTVLLSDDGKFHAWGRGRNGELGNRIGAEPTQPIVLSLNELFDVQLDDIVSATSITGAANAAAAAGTTATDGITDIDGRNEDDTNLCQVSVGAKHTALLVDGRVFTMGDSRGGRLGHFNALGEVKFPSTETKITQISCGADFTIAIGHSPQNLYAWGIGKYGNLGTGVTPEVQGAPVQFHIIDPRNLARKHVIQVSCGSRHALAVCDDGDIFSWGSGENGRLGHGTVTSSSVPRRIDAFVLPYSERIVEVVAGDAHSLARNCEGQLYSWGSGSYGRLGLGAESDQPVPKRIKALDKHYTVSISCSTFHSLAVTLPHDGKDEELFSLFAWGGGKYGKLGTGNEDNQLIPVPVPFFCGNDPEKQVINAKCGLHHTIAVTVDGNVYAWGCALDLRCGMPRAKLTALDRINQLESQGMQVSFKAPIPIPYFLDPEIRGSLTSAYTPPELNLNAMMEEQDEKLFKRPHITRLAAGQAHSIVVADGQVWAWGNNDYGELGTGFHSLSYRPLRLGLQAKVNIIEVACGAAHSLALAQDGVVFAWGNNEFGQLGTGDRENSEYPKMIQSLQGTYVDHIYCGDHHNAAIILSDYSYSFERYAALSFHAADPRWLNKSVRKRPPFARLYTWGSNSDGQLGLGERPFEYETSPKLLRLAQEFHNVSVGLGSAHTVFLGSNYDISSPVIERHKTKFNLLLKHSSSSAAASSHNDASGGPATPKFSTTDWMGQVTEPFGGDAFPLKTTLVFACGRNDHGQLGIGYRTDDAANEPLLVQDWPATYSLATRMFDSDSDSDEDLEAEELNVGFFGNPKAEYRTNKMKVEDLNRGRSIRNIADVMRLRRGSTTFGSTQTMLKRTGSVASDGKRRHGSGGSSRRPRRQGSTNSSSDGVIGKRVVQYPIVRSIAAGGNCCYAVVAEERIDMMVAWGEVPGLQPSERAAPTTVNELSEATLDYKLELHSTEHIQAVRFHQITVGERHCFSLIRLIIKNTERSFVFAWGDTKYGKLGVGNISDLWSRTVRQLKDAAHSDASIKPLLVEAERHAQNTTTLVPFPVDNLLDKEIVELSCNTNHSMAVSRHGVVYVWGYGDKGRLGLGEGHGSKSLELPEPSPFFHRSIAQIQEYKRQHATDEKTHSVTAVALANTLQLEAMADLDPQARADLHKHAASSTAAARAAEAAGDHVLAEVGVDSTFGMYDEHPAELDSDTMSIGTTGSGSSLSTVAAARRRKALPRSKTIAEAIQSAHRTRRCEQERLAARLALPDHIVAAEEPVGIDEKSVAPSVALEIDDLPGDRTQNIKHVRKCISKQVEQYKELAGRYAHAQEYLRRTGAMLDSAIASRIEQSDFENTRDRGALYGDGSVELKRFNPEHGEKDRLNQFEIALSRFFMAPCILMDLLDHVKSVLDDDDIAPDIARWPKRHFIKLVFTVYDTFRSRDLAYFQVFFRLMIQRHVHTIHESYEFLAPKTIEHGIFMRLLDTGPVANVIGYIVDKQLAKTRLVDDEWLAECTRQLQTVPFDVEFDIDYTNQCVSIIDMIAHETQSLVGYLTSMEFTEDLRLHAGWLYRIMFNVIAESNYKKRAARMTGIALIRTIALLRYVHALQANVEEQESKSSSNKAAASTGGSSDSMYTVDPVSDENPDPTRKVQEYLNHQTLPASASARLNIEGPSDFSLARRSRNIAWALLQFHAGPSIAVNEILELTRGHLSENKIPDSVYEFPQLVLGDDSDNDNGNDNGNGNDNDNDNDANGPMAFFEYRDVLSEEEREERDQGILLREFLLMRSIADRRVVQMDSTLLRFLYDFGFVSKDVVAPDTGDAVMNLRVDTYRVDTVRQCDICSKCSCPHPRLYDEKNAILSDEMLRISVDPTERRGRVTVSLEECILMTRVFAQDEFVDIIHRLCGEGGWKCILRQLRILRQERLQNDPSSDSITAAEEYERVAGTIRRIKDLRPGSYLYFSDEKNPSVQEMMDPLAFVNKVKLLDRNSVKAERILRRNALVYGSAVQTLEAETLRIEDEWQEVKTVFNNMTDTENGISQSFKQYASRSTSSTRMKHMSSIRVVKQRGTIHMFKHQELFRLKILLPDVAPENRQSAFCYGCIPLDWCMFLRRSERAKNQVLFYNQLEFYFLTTDSDDIFFIRVVFRDQLIAHSVVALSLLHEKYATAASRKIALDRGIPRECHLLHFDPKGEDVPVRFRQTFVFSPELLADELSRMPRPISVFVDAQQVSAQHQQNLEAISQYGLTSTT
jgi:alpha-tubulin suppressor-like RCC1 family protein